MNHVIYLKLRKKLLLLQAEQIHKMTTGPFWLKIDVILWIFLASNNSIFFLRLR